jgi:thioredoxin reductase
MTNPLEIKLGGFDVLVIGGGPAGLSAAMTLGRVGRSVLVCDDKRPRNAPSSHINNLLGQDGIHPETWRSKVREDLKKYASVQVIEDTVNNIIPEGKTFKASIGRNFPISFRKLILAYGIEDQFPSISGIKELFGKKIFHCPYCHGFEYKDKRLALIASGDHAFHMMVLLRGLSENVVVCSNGNHNLREEHSKIIERHNIRIIEEKIESIQETDRDTLHIILKDGRNIERDAVSIGPIFPLKSKSPIGDQLGCKKTELGNFIVTERGETNVAGVYAAGDIATQAHSVQLASVLSEQSRHSLGPTFRIGSLCRSA